MHLPAKNPTVDAYDEGFGTGIIVASGIWGSDILTVAHVVHRATDVRVRLDDGRTSRATLISQNSDRDLALVRVYLPNLPVALLGSSTDLHSEIAREVGVLGYPIPDEFHDQHLGRATSFVAGRLSAIRRGALEIMIPIVPGESGGPVFFLNNAEIIGIAQSRFGDEHSIGLAIPSDVAREYLHAVDAEHGF